MTSVIVVHDIHAPITTLIGKVDGTRSDHTMQDVSCHWVLGETTRDAREFIPMLFCHDFASLEELHEQLVVYFCKKLMQTWMTAVSPEITIADMVHDMIDLLSQTSSHALPSRTETIPELTPGTDLVAYLRNMFAWFDIAFVIDNMHLL